MDKVTVPPDAIEHAGWPYVIYFTTAYISAPLYIAIIVRVIKNRKLTHFTSIFYTLVISQGVADLFYICSYTLFIIFSYVGTMENAGHFLKYTTANITYKAIYYALSLRCFGVTLISFQRYLVVCRWNSALNEAIKRVPPICIALAHWAISLVFIIPILSMSTVRFGCVCKRIVAIDAEDFGISTINAEALVLVLFALCVLFYGSTLRFIFAREKGLRERRREIRLCIPVAVLVLAFALIFIYYFSQMISIITTGDQYRPLRVLEPLFIGFLTFITPWTLLFFNRDISRLFKIRMFKMNKPTKVNVNTNAALCQMRKTDEEGS